MFQEARQLQSICLRNEAPMVYVVLLKPYGSCRTTYMYGTFSKFCDDKVCILGFSYRPALAGWPFVLHAGSISPGTIIIVALGKLEVPANRLTSKFREG